MGLPDKIILAGFMGTGKSAVGKELAQKLNYPFIDTDALVEKDQGKSIAEIFSRQGERAFRRMESHAIDRALHRPRAVIAVGGGAVCSRSNLKKLQEAGRLLLLTAREDTVLQRVARENHRPLLKVGDPRGEVRRLLAKRAPFYSQITWQLPTDGKSPRELAKQILAQLPLQQAALTVHLKERTYPIYFQRNGGGYLSAWLRQHCPAEQLVLVTNTVVDRHYGSRIAALLKKNFKVHKVVLPDGERYKNLKTVQDIYRELVKFKVDRKTPLIALGGGVLGDMVGFTAATFLRGIPFVQIPTTLLAMVDSSIGGKTGVDLPQGKNLVGSFYQPKFVWIDESFLATLTPRQFVCGMAEVIKYGAIFDAKLFRTLEDQMEKILRSQGKGMEAIIRRCCEWKAWVVEKDELETRGLRSKLNFGHTLGHAIESLTQYKKYTHGEAIAMGMSYAADLSVKKSGLSQRGAHRLKGLLKTAGLPTQWPSYKKSQWLQAVLQDKKRVSGKINFVYLKKIGRAEVISTPLDEIMG